MLPFSPPVQVGVTVCNVKPVGAVTLLMVTVSVFSHRADCIYTTHVCELSVKLNIGNVPLV